jgi:hypothetical protein
MSFYDQAVAGHSDLSDAAPDADPGDPSLLCAAQFRLTVGGPFEAHYQELAELYEDELCDAIVLIDVADSMTLLVQSSSEQAELLLERYCDAIERCCVTDGIDPLIEIYDQLLLMLPPVVLERLRPYLGPATLDLLELAETGPAETGLAEAGQTERQPAGESSGAQPGSEG